MNGGGNSTARRRFAVAILALVAFQCRSAANAANIDQMRCDDGHEYLIFGHFEHPSMMTGKIDDGLTIQGNDDGSSWTLQCINRTTWAGSGAVLHTQLTGHNN
jgi:hypothetical protein